jgi:hypothetical protein
MCCVSIHVNLVTILEMNCLRRDTIFSYTYLPTDYTSTSMFEGSCNIYPIPVFQFIGDNIAPFVYFETISCYKPLDAKRYVLIVATDLLSFVIKLNTSYWQAVFSLDVSLCFIGSFCIHC